MLSLFFSLNLGPVLKPSFSINISVTFCFLLLNLISCRIGILPSTFTSFSILFFHFDSQWMLAHTRRIWFQLGMSLPIQPYSVAFYSYIFILFLPLTLRTKHHVFLFCVYPWPYILNIWTSSSDCADVFSIAIHMFSNLFSKICSLFGQILIAYLKCSKTFFLPSFYNEKISWGRGCGSSTYCDLH